MSVYWTVNILLGCMFSQAALALSICNCNDQLKTVCAAPRETVHVPCPNLSTNYLMFNLIKNEKVIFNSACNITNDTLNCVHKLSHDNTVLEKQTGFTLTVTNISSHGIYKCESKSMFPPPVKKETGSSKILVLVQGHQCLSKMPEGDKGLGIVWIAVLVFLCTYSLIVSVVAVVNWVKLKRSDSYSDYMNTKPRPSKDRKKRRGIQTPTPQYF